MSIVGDSHIRRVDIALSRGASLTNKQRLLASGLRSFYRGVADTAVMQLRQALEAVGIPEEQRRAEESARRLREQAAAAASSTGNAPFSARLPIRITASTTMASTAAFRPKKTPASQPVSW